MKSLGVASGATATLRHFGSLCDRGNRETEEQRKRGREKERKRTAEENSRRETAEEKIGGSETNPPIKLIPAP